MSEDPEEHKPNYWWRAFWVIVLMGVVLAYTQDRQIFKGVMASIIGLMKLVATIR